MCFYSRDDIFLTSKVWCTHHNQVEAALDRTLADLGTDYIDLYLIHWPIALNPNGNDPKFPKTESGGRDLDKDWDPCTQTWAQMEAVLKTGKAKAVGVSNCSISYVVFQTPVLRLTNPSRFCCSLVHQWALQYVDGCCYSTILHTQTASPPLRPQPSHHPERPQPVVMPLIMATLTRMVTLVLLVTKKDRIRLTTKKILIRKKKTNTRRINKTLTKQRRETSTRTLRQTITSTSNNHLERSYR